MSGGIWDFSSWQTGLWPYVALVVFVVIPSEFWRMISIFLVRGVDPRSEILEWVRAVSNALLAAVVANIIVAPSGALASVPLAARIGAMVLAMAAYLAFRRSVLAGVCAGTAMVIGAAYYFN